MSNLRSLLTALLLLLPWPVMAGVPQFPQTGIQAGASDIGAAQVCASADVATTSTAYTCTTTPNRTLVAGTVIVFQPNSFDVLSSITAPTLAANGGSALPILGNLGQAALQVGDIPGGAGPEVELVLNQTATAWILVAPGGGTLSRFSEEPGVGWDGWNAGKRRSATALTSLLVWADSMFECSNLVSPCNYGPANPQNTVSSTLIAEIGKLFNEPWTGPRPIYRLVSINTISGGPDGGYVLTSGTCTVSTLYGPQETGDNLNGGSLCQLSSGAVLTITVGQPFGAVAIECVQDPTASRGLTVVLNGVTVGTACSGTSGSATGFRQAFQTSGTFSSSTIAGTVATLGGTVTGVCGPGAVLTGTGVTAGTTVTTVAGTGTGGAGTYNLDRSSTVSTATSITCTGGVATGTFTLTGGTGGALIYAYDAQVSPFTSYGMVVSNPAVGGINGVDWWFQNATGTGFAKLDAAVYPPAACLFETGENEASSGSLKSAAQMIAGLAAAQTFCSSYGGSLVVVIPPAYSSPSSTVAEMVLVQQTEWNWAIQNKVPVINLGDLSWGAAYVNGAPNFTYIDTNADQGCQTNDLRCGDAGTTHSQHYDDRGAKKAAAYVMQRLFPGHIVIQDNPNGNLSDQGQHVALNTAASITSTTGQVVVDGNTTTPQSWVAQIPAGEKVTFVCRGHYSSSITTNGMLRMEVLASQTPVKVSANLWVNYNNASGSLFMLPLVAASTLTTAGSATATGTNYPFIFEGFVIGNTSTAGTVSIAAAIGAAGTITLDGVCDFTQ